MKQESMSVVARAMWAQKLANEFSTQAVMVTILRGKYKPVPLTRLQRFWIGFKIPFQRMRDAWLVLIGRADIDAG